MADTQDLIVRLTMENGQYVAAVKKTDRENKKNEKSTNKLRSAVSKLRLGYIAVASVLSGVLVKGLSAVIKKTSDAEETAQKFGVVFRRNIDGANKSVKELNKSYGLSTQEARTLLSATGDLLSGFKFTDEQTLDLSSKVQKLSADLASFTNFSGGAKGASEALTKALLGERESVKALGIAILEKDVKAKVKALEATGRFTDETERQKRAIATLDIAFEQSKNAIGDFERSQNSFANQSRILTGRIEDLTISIGNKLLPTFTKLVTKLSDVAGGTTDIEIATREYKNSAQELVKAQEQVNKLQKEGKEDTQEYENAIRNQTLAQTISINKSKFLKNEISLLSNEIKKSPKEIAKLNKEIESLSEKAEKFAKKGKELSGDQGTLSRLFFGDNAEKAKFTIKAQSDVLEKIKSKQEDINKITQKEVLLLDARNILYTEFSQLEKKEEDDSDEESTRTKKIKDEIIALNELVIKQSEKIEQEKANSLITIGLLEEEIAKEEEGTARRIALEELLTQKKLQELNKRKKAVNDTFNFINRAVDAAGNLAIAIDEKVSNTDAKSRKEQKERAKAFFLFMQAAALAQNVVTTILGANNVFAADPFTPYQVKVGQAASIIANGVIGGATIAAQTIKGFENGGIISGLNDRNAPGNEDGIIAAQNGEAVLNREATARLGADAIEALNEGRELQGQTVNITINGGDINEVENTMNKYFKSFGGSRQLAIG